MLKPENPDRCKYDSKMIKCLAINDGALQIVRDPLPYYEVTIHACRWIRNIAVVSHRLEKRFC